MSCLRNAVPLSWIAPRTNRVTPATFWVWIVQSQSRQIWTQTTLSCWTCASPLLPADPQQHPPLQLKMATQRTKLPTRLTGLPPQELQMDSLVPWRSWPWKKSTTDHIPDHQYLDYCTRPEEGSNAKGGSTCCRPVRSHQMS